MGTVSRSAITILLAAAMGAGCLSGDDTDPGWAAFRDAAAREVDGHTIYVVEWDRAVTLDELRAYYDRAKPVDGTVDTVGTADDVWSTDAAQHLTYCVTDTFPAADKQRAVNEMHLATRAWE